MTQEEKELYRLDLMKADRLIRQFIHRAPSFHNDIAIATNIAAAMNKLWEYYRPNGVSHVGGTPTSHGRNQKEERKT